MKPTRASILDADSFQESEMNASIGNIEGFQTDSIKIVLELLLLFSIFVNGRTTSGMDFQNIKRSSRRNRSVLFLIMILNCARLPYFASKFETFGYRFDTFTKAFDVAKLISLLLFISGSLKESGVVNNIIGSIPFMQESTTQRIVSTDLVSRFIFFETLSSLALFVVPHFDLRQFVRRLIPGPENGCGVCGSESIVFPQKAFPCGHRVYCYYCVATMVPFSCGQCGNVVSAFSP